MVHKQRKERKKYVQYKYLTETANINIIGITRMMGDKKIRKNNNLQCMISNCFSFECVIFVSGGCNCRTF